MKKDNQDKEVIRKSIDNQEKNFKGLKSSYELFSTEATKLSENDCKKTFGVAMEVVL